MEEKVIETRLTEKRFRTNDSDKAIGMYLTETVYRKWMEDFVDEEKGETVKIERKEIIAQKGRRIDDDLVASLKFHVLAEDIVDFEVSSQCRQAFPAEYAGLYPYRVCVSFDGKKSYYVVRAQGLVKAIDVVSDYIELNSTGAYNIVKVEALESFNIIETDKFVAPEENAPADDENPNDTVFPMYYRIDARITIVDEEKDATSTQQSFLLKALNVDQAKEIIKQYIEQKFEENKEKVGEREIQSLVITTGMKYSCNVIVDGDFCLAYKEQQN